MTKTPTWSGRFEATKLQEYIFMVWVARIKEVENSVNHSISLYLSILFASSPYSMHVV